VSALSSGTPIANLAEAERAIVSLNNIMDRLTETVEEETARVRAGRLRDAAELEQAKDELAARYGAETNRLKAAKDIIAASLPEALDRAGHRACGRRGHHPRRFRRTRPQTGALDLWRHRPRQSSEHKDQPANGFQPLALN
jgi:hypothetical protein